MTIRVMLFAVARDAAGTGELMLTIPEGSSVDDLLEALFQQYPTLRGFQGILRVAVNEEYSLSTQRLHDGDDVAIIPPVSGG